MVPWPSVSGVNEFSGTHLRLCAHADDAGGAPHWLGPGETCDRERIPDLLASPDLLEVRADLDQAGPDLDA